MCSDTAYDSASQEAKVADQTRTLEDEQPVGDPPSFVPNLELIGVIAVQGQYLTNGVRYTEQSRLEVRRAVRRSFVTVDVNDGRAEEMLRVHTGD